MGDTDGDDRGGLVFSEKTVLKMVTLLVVAIFVTSVMAAYLLGRLQGQLIPIHHHYHHGPEGREPERPRARPQKHDKTAHNRVRGRPSPRRTLTKVQQAQPGHFYMFDNIGYITRIG